VVFVAVNPITEGVLLWRYNNPGRLRFLQWKKFFWSLKGKKKPCISRAFSESCAG